MSIALNETFHVRAAPDRVWQFLKNPAEVVTCLPGAELTETIDAHTYGGRVKVKVGPITAKYAGRATLVEVDEETRRMQIVAEGKESGGSGSARMTLNGHVTALADGSSEVRVDAAIDIAGRVMQFGRGLIESVNKQLFRQFVESVQAKLDDTQTGEEPGTGAGGTGAGGVGGTSNDAISAPQPHSQRPDTPASHGAERHTDAPVVQRSDPNVRAPDRSPAPVASGEALQALPLLWKALRSWLAGLFGKRR